MADRDDALRERLRRLSAGHPRWGYRLAWSAVRAEGWAVNRKKIQRLWREEGLRVPQRKRKRQRLGEVADGVRDGHGAIVRRQELPRRRNWNACLA